MKSVFKKIMATVTLSVMSISLAACGGGGGRESITPDKVNNSKTQLYVKYCNGGFGRTWIDKLCEEFEEMYKDVSFEEGKTGVQIMKDFDKRNVEVGNMRGNINKVFLMEDTDYYTFLSKETLLDITDVVTDYAVTGVGSDGKAVKESKETIEDKMLDVYKKFFNVGTETAPKYYGLPLFETSININYNIDLFNRKGLYFAEGQTAENFTEADFANGDKIADLFDMSRSDGAKSWGPDNKKGTYDDGLPATYKDFRALMTYMQTVGVTPFVWNGYEMGYLTGLINDMWANNEGAEQMMLNFTFDGTAKNLVEMDSDGKIVKENGGYKMLGDTVIDGDNYWKLQQQKGKLQAMEFAKLIMTNIDGQTNYYSKSFDSGFLHSNAQDFFLKPSDYNYSKDVAFLVDGGWWYKEMDQRQAFVTEEQRLSYNFGVLPLPKADASMLGQPNTKVSDRKSWIFVNKDIDEKIIPLAKAFVSFLQNDHALETYTRYTDAFRAMKYTVSEDTLAHMSPYGRSVNEMRTDGSTVILPWLPLSETTRQNLSLINYRKYGFSWSSVEGNPLIHFEENPELTYEQYFEQVYKFRKA